MHFIETRQQNLSTRWHFRKKYDWKFNEKALRQWMNGNTREPLVNANMIELQQTGFMSNRGRQNVVSYWAKEWEQDWRVAAILKVC
nr:FAD-binding domain-containing protein [Flavobacterium piscinae]